MDRTFQKFDGEKINNAVSYVKKYTQDSEEFEVVVGTDSQVYSGHTKFVTAICMYDGDCGAHVIYHSNNVHRDERELFNRLWEEAEATIEVAGHLSAELGTAHVVTHFDINPSEEYRSNVAHKAAVGMAESAGYAFNVKPEAWAATCAADHLN
jgi:predicted RNase H-related nuclease YkuK (DUF458 family)